MSDLPGGGLFANLVGRAREEIPVLSPRPVSRFEPEPSNDAASQTLPLSMPIPANKMQSENSDLKTDNRHRRTTITKSESQWPRQVSDDNNSAVLGHQRETKPKSTPAANPQLSPPHYKSKTLLSENPDLQRPDNRPTPVKVSRDQTHKISEPEKSAPQPVFRKESDIPTTEIGKIRRRPSEGVSAKPREENPAKASIAKKTPAPAPDKPAVGLLQFSPDRLSKNHLSQNHPNHSTKPGSNDVSTARKPETPTTGRRQPDIDLSTKPSKADTARPNPLLQSLPLNTGPSTKISIAIGRVEIRAVKPLQQQTGAPGKSLARAAVSLDGYLAGKRGEPR